ncbi:ATPase, T2SS/T4P/T4SS family [Myxococcus fulvus]|uniref:ATPase, T2SS/T4P/T4SS family n=1 Tax=Myxococcus fulvus TaxID=33 RepID=UPI0020BE5A34|nr:ATPase, T2SS/T4P/T4SS family [Myxococcus fulvus]MCK8499089.1 Flp pilus assembly complex ATPase component TadA [Myxococcus fulvus]
MSNPVTSFVELLSGLHAGFTAESLVVPEPAARPESPAEAASALFSLAARTGTLVFSVWADAETDEAGASFFLPVADAPGHEGLLGQQRKPVRQPFARQLHAPLARAIAELSKRGRDTARPGRGTVTYPFGVETDPEVLFWVTFADSEVAPSIVAHARSRKLRADQQAFSTLSLGREEAVYLTERFLRLDSLFQGTPVVFSGEKGTGRSTSLHAVMEVLPDFTNVLAALEQPRSADARLGTARVGESMPLAQVLRAFLRQDPDVVLADEARTVKDLELLLNCALTGHATAFVLEASSPEAVLEKLREAIPGLPVAPLIVHHSREASGALRREIYTVRYGDDGKGLVEAWRASAAG